MAFVTLNKKKLAFNFEYLNKLFSKNNIQWAVVSKLLCGNKMFLEELLKLDIKQVCDSRLSNLKNIKSINPKIETIYIKPPPRRAIKGIVEFADISLNTQLETIVLLSNEAVKQNKIHKVIIMIEMGELREGVMRDYLIEFYSKVFNLPNIEIVGIGTNFACLYGVLPNPDKFIQLSLYKELIEAKFLKKIPLVSGGSSVAIPLLLNRTIPTGINHFRIGETLFLGTNVYNSDSFSFLKNDVFRLYAEIIELIEKPTMPSGEMGHNVEGNSYDFDHSKAGDTSYRAIVDLGLLDVDERHISPINKDISFAGASSDMLVIDLKDNNRRYKVGDLLEFKMDYMGTLRILNSKYIDKKVV